MIAPHPDDEDITAVLDRKLSALPAIARKPLVRMALARPATSDWQQRI